MKKFITLIILFCTVMISSTAFAARGIVTFYNDSSHKIIIKTDRGFTCGEVTNMPMHLSKGDEVEGDLESSGSREIYNLTVDETFSLWIDDYWLDSDRVLDWLERNC